MANLARNKLPLEEGWSRPELATDGNSANYTGLEGFASKPFPCTYTLDLEKERQLFAVRFLLWDGHGHKPISYDGRKYKFSLSLSSDNQNYTRIFSNEDGDGGAGWFIIRFTIPAYARYVRLTGIHNTANADIHIVEFEVHDEQPPGFNTSSQLNIQNVIPTSGTISEEKITYIVNEVILNKSRLLEDLETKSKSLDSSLKKSNELLDQVDLIKQSIDFTKESRNNNIRSIVWLISSIVVFGITLRILYWFLYCDNHSSDLIINAAKNEAVKPYTTFLLSAYYVTKAAFLSILLFLFGWLLKNYRSEKHNYVINKHKAMTLTVATGILTKEEYKGTDRGNIFIRAMEIIFSHQASGFSTEESSPSLVNTVLQKETPKE